MEEGKKRVGAGLWGKHIHEKREKEGNQVEKKKSNLIFTKEGRISVRYSS